MHMRIIVTDMHILLSRPTHSAVHRQKAVKQYLLTLQVRIFKLPFQSVRRVRRISQILLNCTHKYCFWKNITHKMRWYNAYGGICF